MQYFREYVFNIVRNACVSGWSRIDGPALLLLYPSLPCIHSITHLRINISVVRYDHNGMHRPALTGVQERKYQHLGPKGEGGGRLGPLS